MRDYEAVRELTFDLGVGDLRAFNNYAVLFATKYRWIAIVFMLVYLVSLLWLAHELRHHKEFIWFVVGIVAVVLTTSWFTWVMPVMRGRKLWATMGRTTMVATPDVLEIVHAQGARRIRWSNYSRVVVSKRLVILFTTTTTATIIPIRAFKSADDASDFGAQAEKYRLNSSAILVTETQPEIETWPPRPAPLLANLVAPGPAIDAADAASLSYDMTERDCVWANSATFAVRVGLPFLYGSLFLSYEFLMIAHTRLLGSSSWKFVPAFGIYLVFLCVISFRTNYRLIVATKKNSFVRTEIRTDYETLQMVTPLQAFSAPVATFWKVRRQPRSVVVHLDRANSVIIPARAFASPDEAKVFVVRMRAAIAAGKGMR